MKEIAKPYGYILIDTQPKTTSEKRVVSDVFDHCQSYPHIPVSTHTNSEVTQGTPEMESLPIESKQSAKKSKGSVKHKVELEKPPAKKPRMNPKKPKKQSKPAKKHAKAKPKKQRKPGVYKPRESLSSEEFNSDEEPHAMTFEEKVNFIATQHKGFVPKMLYE